ncbi:BlaI/MecI/CopY family transcriptional regulator [Candidatus Puniceispirillum marinum]|jgi:predicted transcriptional regulator|uniref:Transcriptional regulator, putative n=1 Tax=Puniceispirillum marinum (strain IMCC1322) TaxID=488538 RepID=D5BS78_PUNMI|nr:BlaI/MecI/CopY family transcriptional regulator [Candidatus Puniceispirillum marinum]ADE39125.1 transcriptional regulator, putative [Candidatus Puniceispirillum marinum IMCC1322]
MRQKKNSMILTEVELEFMSAVWQINGGTVRQVMAQLDADRDLAYTSASTILRILEQKNFLVSERSEKSFIYKPLIEKEDYQSTYLMNVSQKLFDNTPSAMVARLVDDENLTEDMLSEMRELLDRRLEKNAK